MSEYPKNRIGRKLHPKYTALANHRALEHKATSDCQNLTGQNGGTDSQLPPYSNFCRCGGCGLVFLNVAAFDVHRVGPADDRVCTATPQLPSKDLQPDPRGYWRLPKREFRRWRR